MKKVFLLTVLLITSFQTLSSQINISPIPSLTGGIVVNAVFETPIKQLEIGPSFLLAPRSDYYTLGIRSQYHHNPLDQNGFYHSLGAFPIYTLENKDFINNIEDKSTFIVYVFGHDWKTSKSKTIKLGLGLMIPISEKYDYEEEQPTQLPLPIIEFQYGWLL